MRALRLIVAGLIAVVALLSVLFAAVVVVFTGLVAYVVQLFRRPAGPTPAGPALAPRRPTRIRMDDAIDVVTTKAPADPPAR